MPMWNIGHPLHKIGGGLLGSTLDARGTDASFAAERHTHLGPTAITGEPRNPETPACGYPVSTKLEGTEGLLYVSFERTISVAEPAIVGRQERLKVIGED